jgi:hypothetical protein
MDLKHFGDAYDLVKRSLLLWLESFGPWVAHPMFTHAVTDDEASAFSRLLGIPLASTEVLASGTDRNAYMAAAKKGRSVFLDPDTGVRLHRRERHRSVEFVFADELVAIAAKRPNGLVLVFDQSVARGSEREQVQAKLEHLARLGVTGFSYISQACFLVLGTSSALVDEARSRVLTASNLPETRLLVGPPPNIGLLPTARVSSCE